MDQSHIAAVNETVMDEEEELHTSGLRRKLEHDFDIDTPVKRRKAGGLLPGQEHMKVFLRVRPLTEVEVERDEKKASMKIEPTNHTVTLQAPEGSNTFKNSQHGCGKQTHKFTFSKIFAQETSQKEFFDSSVLETVKNFIEGQNCLIFTYGVTNSGKTYTIQGNPKDGGILPRTLDVLFNSIDGRQWEDMSLKPSMFCDVVKLTPRQEECEQKIKQRVLNLVDDDEIDVTVSSLVGESDASRLTIGSQMSEDSLNQEQNETINAAEKKDKETIQQLFKEAEERVREDGAIDVNPQGQIRFSVWVTFTEIYNEYLYDLLEPIPKGKNARRPTLALREDKNGVPYVKGLKQLNATSADEAYKILTIGKKNLQMACTKLNHNSSRSHCIFTIKVLRVVDKDNPHVARVSMLSFCDLAGAERYSKTQSTGDRMKEAGNINTSLLALGRCIKVLRHNQQYREHQQIVPFRDSKLTRLFQSFFCGKGRACMIVNINQCAIMFDETLHALKYSAVAKQVISIQDPPKEKERKPIQRPHRFVSLALAQSSSTGPRPTIGFATPGTLLKILKEEEEVAASVPVPSSDEDLVEDSEEDMKEKIIETLKAKILRDKDERIMLEWRIREEVCREMQEQLVTIETEYEDRIRNMQDRIEERADARVNLFRDSIKKRKRSRPDDEDEVTDIDSELRGKVATIQKLEAHVAQLEKQLSQLQGQLARANTPSLSRSEEDAARTSVIEQLQRKLADYRDQVSSKDTEIEDLNEMLAEAGETFKEKGEEISQLQKAIDSYEAKFAQQEKSLTDMSKLLDESQAAMADAEKQLQAKDAELTEIKSTSNQECTSCQEQVVRLGEVISKLADTEAEVDKLNIDFVRTQRQATQKEEEVTGLKKHLSEREQECAELQQALETSTQISSKVTTLEKQHKNILEKLEEAQGKLLEEGRRSLDMEGRVSALEQSLQQANSALREATLEGAQVKESLQKAEENLLLVEEKHKNCKPRILDLQEQLDDYILKVNEKAEEFGDLSDRFKLEKDKYAELEAKVNEMEKASLDKDGELVNLRNKVQDLEARLKAERKQQKSAGSELDELLQSKAIVIEELNTKVTQLGSQLHLKGKKLTDVENDFEALNLKHIQVAADLEAQKKKTVETNQKSAEQGEELMELKVQLEQATEQLELRQNELDSIKLAQTVSAETEQTKSLLEKIQKLESEVSEAHVNDCTLRHEKTQVEHKLKETEEELSLIQKKMKALEEKIACGSDDVENLKKQLVDQTKKASRLDGIVQDLEDCLKSAKSGQQTAVETAESYKQKYHDLVEEIASKEDRLQSLDGELTEIKEDRNRNIRVKQEEIEKLNESVYELEHKCKEYRSGMETLEARLSYIEVLEEKNNGILSELEERDGKVREGEDKVATLEATCKELQRKYKEELATTAEQLDSHKDKCNEQANRIKELEEEKACSARKVEELGTKCALVNQLEADLKEERSHVAQVRKNLSEKTEELDKVKSDLETLGEEKITVEKSLQAEKTSRKTCELEFETAKHEATTLGKQVEKLMREELTMKDTARTLRVELEVQQTKIVQLEEQVEASNTIGKEKVSILDELDKAQKREKNLRKELQESCQVQEEQNAKFIALEARLKEAKEKSSRHSSDVRADKLTIKSLQEEVTELRLKLTTTSEQQSTKERQLSETGEKLIAKIHMLEGEVEKKEKKLSERSRQMTDLMQDIDSVRSSYNIKLQDAAANEKVITQLKQTIEDQAVANDLQDKFQLQLQEDMSEKEKEYESLLAKYNKTMKDKGSNQQAVRDFEAQVRLLRSQKEAAERATQETEGIVESLKIDVKNGEKARSVLMDELQETNREMRKMEKMVSDHRRQVSELRAERELQGKTQHTNSRDEQKLEMLRKKFTALESTNREFEKEVMRLKNEVNAAEQKKQEEFKKFREDRDTLVHQLEKILQDNQVKMAQYQANNDRLTAELRDREVTVQDLSLQLRESVPSTPASTRGRRKTRQRVVTEEVHMMEEVQEQQVAPIPTQESSQKVPRKTRARKKLATEEDLVYLKEVVEVKGEVAPTPTKDSSHEIVTRKLRSRKKTGTAV